MDKIVYLRRVANDGEPTNRIRELREAKGMTQAELANLANVSPSALNKVEMGKRGLDQQWMDRLAIALECTPADLLTDRENPARPKGAEVELLAMFRAADETQRRTMLAMFRTMLSPEAYEALVKDHAA